MVPTRPSTAAAREAGAQDSFQGRVDLGEQAADPVAGRGDLPGQVVVEAGEHRQFGDGVVVDAQGAQGVRQGPGGFGDHGGVPSVGLGRSGVQVSDARMARPGR